MLNSSYGKTCEGLHEQTYELKGAKDFEEYIFRNLNTVESYDVIGNKFFVKQNV
jgi:hypothetical protein